MKTIFTFTHRIYRVLALVVVAFVSVTMWASAQEAAAPMRRPISPQQPMWLIHIDTWNWPDPQKIIDLVPEDIRPYVVMNISLSISHNSETGEMNICPDGYETAKSWLRACAQNRMWATVQCASGGFSHFSETDLSVYEEFYTDFPNFIGWNFAEQFWGFDDPFSCTFLERLGLFTELMKMGHRYGGYLITSFCGAYWGANLNPVAMMKRAPQFAAVCEAWSQHFIMCEKFTMTSCFHEIESVCMGSWLSGYAGQYGIRFDQCGWAEGENSFPTAAGAIPVLSHVMLTGETVIDGPELIWQQDFHEVNKVTLADGYTSRRWERFPQFDNISIDLFRKILDKSVRILNRQEVIDRTKVVLINDLNKGDRGDYMSEETLFDGLYRMDDDGVWLENTSWFKKSGRYPAVPTVYRLNDDVAKSFQVQVRKSGYAKRWLTVADKVAEFNTLFPEEYTGDASVSRVENVWVGYNPYKTGRMAYADIPLLYNTCTQMQIAYNQYSLVLTKEYADSLTFYMTNYRTDDATLRSDTIRIYGSTVTPTYAFADRASHTASRVSATWADGVYTLIVSHNGPLDMTVRCAGASVDRLTEVTPAVLTPPAIPSVYVGPRQYEAECFDYKNISACLTNAFSSGIKGYTGQGFVNFGKNVTAAVRDTVTVDKSGFYRMQLRYSAPDGLVSTVGLYVNGSRVTTMRLQKTPAGSTWSLYERKVRLKAGKNEIAFRASVAASYTLYLDNIVIASASDAGSYDFTGDEATTEATTPAAEMIAVQSGSAGVVAYNDAAGVTDHALTAYTVGETGQTGVADLELFPVDATDYAVVWTAYSDEPSAPHGLLMRAHGASAAAEGLRCGYLFTTRKDAAGHILLESAVVDAESVMPQTSYTSTFTLAVGVPCYYRAIAVRDTLSFECSLDSIEWQGAASTRFIHTAYDQGATQLVWGLGGHATGWVIDDITPLSFDLAVTRTYLSNFVGYYGEVQHEAQSFNVWGHALIGDVQISATGSFEISTAADGEYTSELTLVQAAGEIARTPIYVRLKAGLDIAEYTGSICVQTPLLPARTIALSGSIVPPEIRLVYDFSDDAVRTTPSTLAPAQKITYGTGNGATAAVCDYTDSRDVQSRMLRAYTGGLRNGTGVINLDLFTRQSTNYSVTWRQCLQSPTDSYKVGVVLRANPDKVGTATTGYVQGMMQGYVLVVYNNRTAGNSEFRIYNSTASTNLTMLANKTVSDLNPAVGESVWYRASVSGATSASLQIEYSKDSLTWNSVTVYTDVDNRFTQGATQMIWGLAAAVGGFCVDDITFAGVTYDENAFVGIETPKNDAVVVAEEYYTPAGVRVAVDAGALRGLYLVRRRMSDGRCETRKVWKQ